VQQTPVRIFSALLPGLTVVTDRVSNYAFYPWVAWVHEQNAGSMDLDFIHMLRRAECLLTLVAERHAAVSGEPALFHSLGLVGRNTLVPALRPDSARPIPLGDLAALRNENDGSYFQNEAGGLGQYYLGPLRELGILQRTGVKFEYSAALGLPLAESLDAHVDRASFLRVLKRGTVDEGDLDRLSSLCPCHLGNHAVERDLLIDLLFARNREPTASELPRRQTLLLLLNLASQRDPAGSAPLDAAFRAACLTGALDDGGIWTVPERWRRVQRAWAIYERNDELSIGLLGVFWVALSLLDAAGGWAASASDIGSQLSRFTTQCLGTDAAGTLDAVIAARAKALPPLENWYHPNHEFRRSFDVRTAALGGNVEDCLGASVDLLLSLAARHLEPHPYRDVAIPPDYLTEYPLNLHSFHHGIADGWRELTLADWVGVLGSQWGVEAHLRVALRKMHYESRDRFLLYVTDDGIRRRADTERPLPGQTASRLNRAVQFLVDLGLARWQEPPESAGDAAFAGEWVARLSPQGQQLLEELSG
jgi:hypothetical protein